MAGLHSRYIVYLSILVQLKLMEIPGYQYSIGNIHHLTDLVNNSQNYL